MGATTVGVWTVDWDRVCICHDLDIDRPNATDDQTKNTE